MNIFKKLKLLKLLKQNKSLVFYKANSKKDRWCLDIDSIRDEETVKLIREWLGK